MVTQAKGQGCEGQAQPSWQEVSVLCYLSPPSPTSTQDRKLGWGGEGPSLEALGWLLPQDFSREATDDGALGLQDLTPSICRHSGRREPFSAHLG